MKRIGLVAIPLALLVVMVISACGKTPGNGNTNPGGGAPANTVDMSATDFVQHAITVKAGDTVHFTDPASTGGTHVLCLGHNETCNKTAAGPAKFADPGVTVNPGDPAIDVVFPTAGTYEVTCTVHQNMNVTITVQ